MEVETHVTETTTPDVCEDILVMKDVSFDCAKCKKTGRITMCLRKLDMRDRSVFPPGGCVPSKSLPLGQYPKQDLWHGVLRSEGVRSVRAIKGLSHMCH